VGGLNDSGAAWCNDVLSGCTHDLVEIARPTALYCLPYVRVQQGVERVGGRLVKLVGEDTGR
jgi:hypothetical protein